MPIAELTCLIDALSGFYISLASMPMFPATPEL
jgi:hypothetical protein